MESLHDYQDSFILLTEAGFIAVNQTDEDAATKLFEAASMLKPHHMLPKIGMGYLHLCKLELKQACQLFRDVLAKDPHNEMAQAFLGLSLSLSPTETAKGEHQLEETAKKAKDPMIKTLAISALDFVERFVKKPGSPMHLDKKHDNRKHK
jgi:hypothetical protein